MSINYNTYNSIVHNHLKNFMDTKEDVIRQLLNSGIRNNAANTANYFRSLIDGFRKFNITTEPENIKEWNHFSDMVYTDNLPFEIIAIPPFINKTQEFYTLLIQNTLKANFHNLKNVFESKPNETDRLYLIYQVLRPIEPFFKDIAKIQTMGLNAEYIFSALKISLFNLYIETTRHYSDFIQSEVLTTDEFLYIVDKNYQINRNTENTAVWYITEYLKKTSRQPVKRIEEKKEKSHVEFTPIEADFREGYNGKFDYDTIDKKTLFSKVERSLYDNEFINNAYLFSNIHDKKKELAAIYKILIDKSYFKKRNYKHNTRNFQPYEYRQYLDHRYNVDTSQQFSRLKSHEIQAVIDKYYFLSTL